MEKCLKCNKEHDGSFGSGKYCSISCANSRTFSDESKKRKSESNKNTPPWNKGVKWSITTSKCLYCGSDIKHRKSAPKKYHAECWTKVSGGYRKGSGIGKSGWYKGYWCDSTYELVWVIYQLDHGKPFERNLKKYSYDWDGKTKNYIPDFIQNDTIIEIKGYVTEETKIKFSLIPNLKILFKKDLEKEFEYVKSKYGSDFTRLYE